MIQIELLKNHPEVIPIIASIWHEVLGKKWMPEISIEEVENVYYKELENDMPVSYVALLEGNPIASCTLTLHDGIRPELTPWLADLIVDPKYQGKGIGKMLINKAKEKAVELGFEKLHLFIFDSTLIDYYEHLGWTQIGIDEFHSHPVVVMEVELCKF